MHAWVDILYHSLFLSSVNFLEVTRGIQSPSYHAESDLIISSIKPEISLKINASFKLYALRFGAAKNKEEQEQRALTPWFCMDFAVSWSSLSYLTSPSAPLSCSSWSRHCDVQVIIFLSPLWATLGSTSFVSPEAPSSFLCCCYQTARSGGRGQRAGPLSLCPQKLCFTEECALKHHRADSCSHGVRRHHQSEWKDNTEA